ncbi:MAG TPA: cyclic nucleotide-binding domain-containing protein [Candidatus Sulfomarinibacteraceae bacterium]|nr:cyclic nucleotide-binding domain-containing protein [Candidatus Sulfomarinibacteraceae bacterium]
MTRHTLSRPRAALLVRGLTVVSLLLTLAALLSGLLFVLHTTGGTVFLFSVVAPLCVLLAIAIWVGVEVFEFRQRHTLFLTERFPAGHVVFRQGDPADAAYFIRSGSVEVVDEATGEVLRTLSTGEYFGEIALIADAPRSATIRTASPVEVAVLGKRNFLNMMRLIPATEQAIMETVRKRASRDSGRTA